MTRRELLNKISEITAFFWIVKALCTTVGETAADRLRNSLGLRLEPSFATRPPGSFGTLTILRTS
jgi:uncharacterized membrane-anchored protein